MEIYLRALKGTEGKFIERPQKFMKIGEVAKRAKEAVSTIRHWTSLGLIEVSDVTDSGYSLYTVSVLEKIDEIKRLKKERFTLEEIKSQLKNP